MVRKKKAGTAGTRGGKLRERLTAFLFSQEDIHVSTFNIFAAGGIAVCVMTSLYNALMGFSPWNWLSILGGGIFFSLGMMRYTRRSGRYHSSMVLTVLVVFLGLYTFLFFTSGGYHGGMPFFFILAAVFTAFLFDGAQMIFFVGAELAWYVLLCVYAYFHPVERGPIAGEGAFLIDMLVSMTVVTLVLVGTAHFQVRLHQRRQEALEEARREAEAANLAKTEFLARMSHDVRTPLNTILAMNELILENTSSGEVKEWVRDSSSSAQILLTMVNAMLDISSIEVGRAELHLQPYAVRELVLDAVKTWKRQALLRGLSLQLEAEQTVPSALLGDPMAIRKVLDNLLSNAVKYTESGGVVLHVGFEREAAEGASAEGKLILRISDTGCGIPQKDREIIFQPFERGAAAGSGVTGSGLGLTIVREKVQQMGGNIGCESQEGRGTVFTVCLPQGIEREEPAFGPGFSENGQPKEEAGRAEEDAGQPEGRKKSVFPVAPGVRVLVIDDNEYNRRVMSRLLEPMLIQADDVESGQEALEMLDIKHYDLILMDLRMPGMDGMQLFQKIREEYPLLETPVAALTAEVFEETRESVLKMGFAGYLVKPVSSAGLRGLLEGLLPGRLLWVEGRAGEEMPEEEVSLWGDLLRPYGIDLHRALSVSAGDREEFLLRARLFAQEAEQTMPSLVPAAADYYLKLHSLKSSARGIGAELLAELAQAMELRREEGYTRRAQELLLLEYRRVLRGLGQFLGEGYGEKHGDDHRR